MDEFLELFKELSTQLKSVEDKFIAAHLLDVLSGPEQYKDDVKAYCILSHALFEEFFEEVSISVMKISVEKWYTHKQLTPPLLTLLSYSGSRFELLTEKENMPYVKVFDRLRKTIDATKKQFSEGIKGNHGTSEKYLRNILCPISIDILQDANILNSLSKLSEARGAYAHKNARRTIAPEDSRKYVEDCIKLAEYVRDKAIIHFYEDIYKQSQRIKLINALNLRLRSLI